jgi:hypothetical protein
MPYVWLTCCQPQRIFFSDYMIVPHESNMHARGEMDIPHMGQELQNVGWAKRPTEDGRCRLNSIHQLRTWPERLGSVGSSERHPVDIPNRKAFLTTESAGGHGKAFKSR